MKKLNVFLCTALVLTMAFVTTFAGPVYALPSLQLGPGLTGTWSYETITETWIVGEGSFDLNAYANQLGGNGAYAWDSLDIDRFAYLVVSAVPSMDDATDVFDLTVNNDGSNLTSSSFGFGTPPVSDHNSLAPHGIFPTYFELYEFQFDGAVSTIDDTQPGEFDSGPGYTETFFISINSLAEEVLGVHFDLFTIDTNGDVIAFAPFSHDAESAPPPVPEPATILLLGTGLIALAGVGRKKIKRS
jgi:hypothetical protein